MKVEEAGNKARIISVLYLEIILYIEAKSETLYVRAVSTARDP